jgi:hypothetical protein
LSAKEIRTHTDSSGTRVVSTQDKIRAWMQVIVSVIMLAAGLLVLFAPTPILPHPFDESTKRWAAGWIGVVIGYWLS